VEWTSSRRTVLAGVAAALSATAGCGRLTGRRIPETGAVGFENDSPNRQTAAITVTGPDGTTLFDDSLTAGGRRIAASDPVVTEPGAYDVRAAVGEVTATGGSSSRGRSLSATSSCSTRTATSPCSDRRDGTAAVRNVHPRR
jgi:hypothetical protein